AAGEHRNLRIGLFECRRVRHPQSRAVGRNLRTGDRAVEVAWIGQGGIEARECAEQFADGWRAEALAPSAAESQVVIDLPVESEFAVGGAAERGIVGITRSKVD